METMMLILSHLRYDILRDTIVKDFSLSLQLGEVKTLFGPSGCGKTTILRLIAGLIRPKEGKIQNQCQKIGFLFQENRLLDNLTALQNITVFMHEVHIEQIYETAAKIGLSSSDLNKYPSELSGGMAKRIAFLRLILSGCDLALLDEPFVGLDRDLRDTLIGMLMERVVRKQLACMLVTHDRFEAVRLSSEIMLLSSKGMQVNRRVYLPEDFYQRDVAYEMKMAERYFSDVRYYD